eukprot:m.203406 g.203406  ORF g.203406 m.203406 type:complete len:409 (+) comp26002_c0_seq6:222-1448(+)
MLKSNHELLQAILRSVFSEGELGDIQDQTQQAINKMSKVPITIGVAGETGSGKSTFINTVRGLRPNAAPELRPARTGVVECTAEPTHYPFSGCKNVFLVDLPGCNSQRYPMSTYAEQVGLEKFDMVLILFADRVHDNDVRLAKLVARAGKPFLFVRTKLDESISNHMDDYAGQKKVDVIDRIRKDAEKQTAESFQRLPGRFQSLALQPCYLICGKLRGLSLYDMPKLQKAMLQVLPKVKQHSWILAINSFVPGLLAKKKEALKKLVPLFCLLSGAAAAVPVPGAGIAVDVVLLKSFSNRAARTMGVTPEQLRQLFGDDALITRYGTTFTTTAQMVKLLPTCLFATSSAFEQAFSFIPIAGQVVAAGLSYGSMYCALQICLDVVCENAEAVSRATVNAHLGTQEEPDQP